MSSIFIIHGLVRLILLGTFSLAALLGFYKLMAFASVTLFWSIGECLLMELVTFNKELKKLNAKK
ncbi:MAG: hypothetical protein AAB879_01990 [Patescibacteria group bacterium]